MNKPVQGEKSLYRDMYSKAIINSDKDGYNNRLKRLRKSREFRDEINTLKNDVSELKGSMNKILKILEGKNV
jgi:hypothetical protein